jgi:hypothetical protein
VRSRAEMARPHVVSSVLKWNKKSVGGNKGTAKLGSTGRWNHVLMIVLISSSICRGDGSVLKNVSAEIAQVRVHTIPPPTILPVYIGRIVIKTHAPQSLPDSCPQLLPRRLQIACCWPVPPKPFEIRDAY